MPTTADQTLEQYDTEYQRLKEEISKHDLELKTLQLQDSESIKYMESLVNKRRELNKRLVNLQDGILRSYLLYNGANIAAGSTIDSELSSSFLPNRHILYPETKNTVRFRAAYEDSSDADDESDELPNRSRSSEVVLRRSEKLRSSITGPFDGCIESNNDDGDNATKNRVTTPVPSFVRLHEDVTSQGLRYQCANKHPNNENNQSRALYNVPELDENNTEDACDEPAFISQTKRTNLKSDVTDLLACLHDDDFTDSDVSDIAFLHPEQPVENLVTDDDNSQNASYLMRHQCGDDISAAQDLDCRQNYDFDVKPPNKENDGHRRHTSPVTNVYSQSQLEKTPTRRDYLIPKLYSSNKISGTMPFSRLSRMSPIFCVILIVITLLCLTWLYQEVPSFRNVLMAIQKTMHYLLHWNEEWYRKKCKSTKQVKIHRKTTRIHAILLKLINRFASMRKKM
jgi:hypothetical protein